MVPVKKITEGDADFIHAAKHQACLGSCFDEEFVDGGNRSNFKLMQHHMFYAGGSSPMKMTY